MLLWFKGREGGVYYIRKGRMRLVLTHTAKHDSLDAVAESVERRLPIWKFSSLNPSRIKAMTNKIDTYYYETWCLALIG